MLHVNYFSHNGQQIKNRQRPKEIDRIKDWSDLKIYNNYIISEGSGKVAF